MEQLYLMPGEERYTKFRDENGASVNGIIPKFMIE